MKVAAARIEGVKAFSAGRACAPALNNAFIVAACSQNETETAALLAGYVDGWTYANLAKDALPGAPSIAVHAAILAAAE